MDGWMDGWPHQFHLCFSIPGSLGTTTARETTKKARLCSANTIHLTIQPILQCDRTASISTRTSAIQGRPHCRHISGSTLQRAMVPGEQHLKSYFFYNITCIHIKNGTGGICVRANYPRNRLGLLMVIHMQNAGRHWKFISLQVYRASFRLLMSFKSSKQLICYI